MKRLITILLLCFTSLVSKSQSDKFILNDQGRYLSMYEQDYYNKIREAAIKLYPNDVEYSNLYVNVNSAALYDLLCCVWGEHELIHKLRISSEKYMINEFKDYNDKMIEEAKDTVFTLGIPGLIFGLYVDWAGVWEDIMSYEASRSREEFSKFENFAKKKPIVLLDWKASGSKYLDYSYGLSFRFYNSSKKVVKYIDVVTKAYNRVNDPILDMYSKKSSQSVKIVGPIEIGDIGSAAFNDVWRSNLLHDVKLFSVKVTYMDGTIITIYNPNSLMFNGDMGYSLNMVDLISEVGMKKSTSQKYFE